MKKSFTLRKVVAIAICLAGFTMFSSCDKGNDGDDDNNGGTGNGNTNIGLPFDEYKLPKNLYVEWRYAEMNRITKIGNDYLSNGGNVASSAYCLKYNADTKTWREYIKVYRQDWAPLEEYTEAEIATKLKEDRYLGFILKALDGKGFTKTGLGGVSIGTNDENDEWKSITRSANVYSDGATTLYKDIEYGIVLETKAGETSLQRISFIGTKESFGVPLP